MLFLEDIKIELKCQEYEAKHLTFINKRRSEQDIGHL